MHDKNQKNKLPSECRADLSHVDFEDIDLKNHGMANFADVSFRDSAYTNEVGAVTNVGGKLNSDGPIRNRGIFNIKTTGEVNLFFKKLKDSWAGTWWGELILAVIAGILVGGILYFLKLN